MDYCHRCQRHLNGALACAGCGTPASELIRPASAGPGPGRGDDAMGRSAEVIEPIDVTSRRSHSRPGPRPPVRPGARARRARKSRGRTVLIGGVCLALTAGAWGLVELTQNDEGAGAATSVKEATSPEPEPVPESTATVESPADPVASGHSADSDEATGRPTTSARTTERPRKPAADSRADRTRAPSPTATTDPSSRPPNRTTSPTPSAPGRTAKPPQPRLSPLPTPSPSPSDDCEQFLWWCV